MDEAREDQEAGSEERERREPPPDLLERGVSWVSMALVVALAAFFLWEARQQTSPVVIRAHAGAVWKLRRRCSPGCRHTHPGAPSSPSHATHERTTSRSCPLAMKSRDAPG